MNRQEQCGRGFRGFRGHFREAMEQEQRGAFGHFGGRHHGFRGGRGEGFGGGMESGRGGGMRMFGAGDLRYVILQLLSERPSHGYEIIKSIGERVGGNYAPSPGVIYPMLTMLEEMGHASVVSEGPRKLYSITDEGRRSLEENKAMVEAILARMDRSKSEGGSGPAQQIERAIANFRMTLRMKGHSLTTEQIHAITDIIDAAAKQIERA